ncbi:MAG: Tat pathway signal sequence domain protein [Alphaproteobacteria bacterium]|nr:MAG: Tat pathway signal sequence domain protein [Alphaproteobacteria bacterium]
MELNKLAPHEGDCQVYLVLENGTGEAFKSLKLDLVMFDTQGIVARRLAVEAGPLPAGKTSLKAFDINDLSCNSLGRILLNDVMSCEDAAGARKDCLTFVSTSARTKVPFVK